MTWRWSWNCSDRESVARILVSHQCSDIRMKSGAHVFGRMMWVHSKFYDHYGSHFGKKRKPHRNHLSTRKRLARPSPLDGFDDDFILISECISVSTRASLRLPRYLVSSDFNPAGFLPPQPLFVHPNSENKVRQPFQALWNFVKAKEKQTFRKS